MFLTIGLCLLTGVIFYLITPVKRHRQEIFRNALPSSLLEQVQKNGENEEALSNLLKEYELIVDSDIPRPKDYDEPKKFSSGKKKYHTCRKNQFVVLPGSEACRYC